MDAMTVVTTYARSKGYAGTTERELGRFIRQEAKAAARRAEEVSEKEKAE